jgi:hypothetical protein
MKLKTLFYCLLLFLLASCGGTGNIGSNPSKSLGLVEISFKGIGGSSYTSQARFISSRLQPQSFSSLSGGLQLQLESRVSFVNGGQRYLYASFKARNAEQNGTAHTTPLSNITFLAVKTPNSINNTALSSFLKFDNSPANPSIAPQIKPTHAVQFNSSTSQLETIANREDFQMFTESEASSLGSVAGVDYTFPYGFVVRNLTTPSSRTLPANPAVGVFDGRITFAVQIPMQANPSDDPYSFSMVFEVVADSVSTVSQSIQETPSQANSRVGTMGATLLNLFGDAFITAQSRAFCRVRIAGSAASPTAYVHKTETLVTPIRGSHGVAYNSGVTAKFCSDDVISSSVNNTNFVVQGFMTGKRSGTFSTTNDQTVFTPTSAFKPNEEVEVSLSNLAKQAGGTFERKVMRFRAKAEVASGEFSVRNPEIAVGANPAFVTLGDVNGDSKLDFLTANFNANNVSIRLGDGSGGFTSPTIPQVAVGANPVSVVLVDVNGDTKLDFLTANINASSVSIRLGDGLGGFTSPTIPQVVVGSGPASVALGDVNGDTKLDFVTANINSNNVSIRLGDGLGGFTSPTTAEIAVGTSPVSVALGDFNGDTKLDFITANRDSSNVSIRLGDGLGGFTSPSTAEIAVGTSPVSVALGDFNGDTKLDFITANRDSNNVSIRLGDGLGGFTSPSTAEIAVGSGPYSVALGDVNGDSKLDFLTANYNSNNVSIRLGDGLGSFTSPTTAEIAVGTSPYLVALGDVNGDSKLDFLTANYGSSNVSIRLGDGFGGFTSPTTAEIVVGSGPYSVALGDVNGDSKLDFVTANLNASSVSIRLGDGLGGFTSPSTAEIAVGTTPVSVALGDVNGDSKLDFLTANLNSSNVSIRLGDGLGGFTSPTTPQVAVGTNPAFIALGDVNGDSKLDFLTANYNSSSVSIRLGDGLGGFTSPSAAEIAVSTGPYSVALGDVNGDSKLDFVTTNLAGNVSIRLGY